MKGNEFEIKIACLVGRYKKKKIRRFSIAFDAFY